LCVRWWARKATSAFLARIARVASGEKTYFKYSGRFSPNHFWRDAWFSPETL
jgi:hypothetical protein